MEMKRRYLSRTEYLVNMAINKHKKTNNIPINNNSMGSDIDSKATNVSFELSTSFSNQIINPNDTLDTNLNGLDVDKEIDHFLLHLNESSKNVIISSTPQRAPQLQQNDVQTDVFEISHCGELSAIENPQNINIQLEDVNKNIMLISVHNDEPPSNIIVKENVSEQVTDSEYQVDLPTGFFEISHCGELSAVEDPQNTITQLEDVNQNLMLISVHNDAPPSNINLNENISEQVTDTEYQVDLEEKENVNQKEKRKKLRLQGKTYKTYKRVSQKQYILIERKEREIQPKLCSHGRSENQKEIKKTNRSFMCETISEKYRKKQFDLFWRLESWDAKRAYIKGLVDYRPVIRRRKTLVKNPRKCNGFDCFLPGPSGVKVRVCRNFFLSTFDLRKDTFNNWIQDNVEISVSSNSSINNSENLGNSHKVQNKEDNIENIENNDNKEVKRGEKRKKTKSHIEKRKLKKSNENKNKQYKSDSVEQWLGLLPKVPSHYCRSSSSRTYVEDSFRSYRHMHAVYKEWCLERQCEAVERKCFSEILEKNKISIFKPRKDQCDTCVGFQNGNISKDEYDFHILKKEEARAAKQNAIASCSNTTLVVTMDKQSVLLCPKLLVSKQYYKQKLQFHNFTFYINNNKDVHCYVWHECDGGVTSNEFTTCILDFLEKVGSQFTKIIIISDGCTYQNKNKVLVSALSDYTLKYPEKEIQQVILEKGHTMMEVDSVHSTLERLFNPPIFTPADYVSIIRQARPKQPYVVNQIDFNFFKNFEILNSNYSSIRPGKKVGEATVTDIRALQYKNGDVYYKLRHSEEWTILNQRRGKKTAQSVKPLYRSAIKIEKSKFDSLQCLKEFMHKDNHLFYDNLKTK